MVEDPFSRGGNLISSRPRLVVAGANSGVGKTSVALALVSALRKRGLRVQTFKVGPDYLDPTYHSIVSGKPCYNLDGWMTNREYVRQLFIRSTADADIAVVEGVMGLFDGANPDDLEGSTAETALWLDAPVILVVNVHGLARSLAPIVKGYDEFEPGLELAGVVANWCGSTRHGEMLAVALEYSGLPELVGAIPRGAFPELPGRHLGLVTADSQILTSETVAALGEALERHADVGTLVEIAARAAPLQEAEQESGPSIRRRKVRLGVAYDAAFHFYYVDNLEALEEHGCELVRFSPLAEQTLPHRLDALYIGGGYPEEFAEQLATNKGMLESVRAFAATGKPIYGECGGLMYLSRGIETLEGRLHNLVGLLPARTRMLDRLKSLGYVETILAEDSLFGAKGSRLRGHEFHYSELLNDPAEDSAWKAIYRAKRRRSGAAVPEGYQNGRVLVSYVHMHFASRPEAVKHFIEVCSGVSA